MFAPSAYNRTVLNNKIRMSDISLHCPQIINHSNLVAKGTIYELDHNLHRVNMNTAVYTPLHSNLGYTLFHRNHHGNQVDRSMRR